ncbi:MAG: serine hydroxymethyltransferase, partial [Eubacterium sp.]
IPFDKQKPTIASGVRVGTPAVTTRGLVEGDMVIIADIFELALIKKDLEGARALVKTLTDKYPLYPDIHM